jgi:SAM-dependent methyltransferase
MATEVPERLRWAVETLAIRPADLVLEIGCGHGVALALVCERLTTGRIVAIDRSAKMTAAAAQRNAEHVAAGRAELRTAALESADFPPAERFDKIFAVNVNLFWLRPVPDELALIRRLLRPRGTLYLFYEPPGPRAPELTDKLLAGLAPNGFTTTVSTGTTAAGATLLCVAARPGRPHRR